MSDDQHDYKDVDYRSTPSVPKISCDENHMDQPFGTDKDYRSQQLSIRSDAVNNHTNTPVTSHPKENYLPFTGKFYDYSSWNIEATNIESNTTNGITVSKPSETFIKSKGMWTHKNVCCSCILDETINY